MKSLSAKDVSEGVLALSDDMATKVTRALSRAAASTNREISEHLKAGRFEEAKAVARALEFTEALKKQTKTIKKFTQSAALVGAGALDRPQTSVMSQAGFPFEVEVSAVRQIQAGIERQLTRETRRRLLERISRAERFEKAADPIDPDKLANDINRYLRGEIRRVVDVAANITGTRVASYGFLHEARARGVTRYRIDAVLDDRTTDICRGMDGRQFRVEEAFTRTQEVLQILDPSQLKDAAPFPEQTDATTRSSEYLQNQGHDVPPFHFLCRSVVTLIGTEKEYPAIPMAKFPNRPKEMSDSQRQRFIDSQDSRTRAGLGMKAGDDFEELYDRAFMEVEIDGPDPVLNKAVALQAYAGNVYSMINETLRSRSLFRSAEQREITRTLDTIIDNAGATTQDLVLYRGVGKQVIRELDEIGKVFQDDGFMSTTFNASLPPQYFKEGGGLLQILLPEGSDGIEISRLSQLSAEDEFLLPRGLQLRVIGRQKTTIDGEEVEMIRVVIQGAGRRLDIDNITDVDATIESIVNIAPDRWQSKFSYRLGDLKPATT